MTEPGRDAFQAALSDFTFEAACGAAIRHLADNGCTAKQIMEKLDYPMSAERVRQALYRHLCDTGVILEESPEEGLPGARAEYVLEYDSCGRPSYRRKPAVDAKGSAPGPEAARIPWREMVYRPTAHSGEGVPKDAPGQSGQGIWGKVFGHPGRGSTGKSAVCPGRGAELSAFLTGKCDSQKGGAAYISCDFGIPDSMAAKGVALLNGRQREYLEGIPWPRRRVYHRLDHRMKEILCSLYEQHTYEGVCYFLSHREKLYF